MNRISGVIYLALVLMPLCLQAQWQLQNTGFSDSLREIQSIWAVDENVVWATVNYAGSGDTIQEFTRSVNGGQTWVAGSISGIEGYAPSMIFALNADKAWIAYHHPDVSGGKIMHTFDGGVTWTHQSTALFTQASEAYPNLVYFWDAQHGFLMGDPTDGYFELYTTSNGGNQWNRVDSVNIPPLISGEWGYEREFSVIGNTVWFGTSKGRVFKSVDRGYHWTAINTPFMATGGRCRITEFRDSLHGIVCDRNGSLAVMYETNDGGLSWQSIPPSGTAYGRYLKYIPGTDSTYISSSDDGSAQGVSISYDDGHNWMDASPALSGGFGVLWFPNALAGWAGQVNQVGGAGGILKYLGNTVGLAEELEQGPALYPNPSDGRFWLEHNAADASATIHVFDLSGRLVHQTQMQGNPMLVDVSLLEKGLYMVQFSHEGSKWTRKLLLR